MIVNYNIKKSWPIIISILLLLYSIYCIITLGFNIFVLSIFFVAIVLNIGLFYILTHKKNKKQIGIQFYRIFIPVAYVMYFSFFIIIIMLNIFSKKDTIDINDSYDYVIVFGSSVSKQNEKNTIINKRLDKAVEYANNHLATKFILTGAKVSNDIYEEALYMKEYMLNKGIDEDRVLTDTLSINTFENISNALFIIKNDVITENVYNNILDSPVSLNNNYFNLNYLKIGLLSTDFHIFRINLMSNKLGIEKQYDISVDSDFSHKLYLYVQECLSLYKALVLGQLF